MLATLDGIERVRPEIGGAFLDDPLEPGVVSKSLWNLDHKRASNLDALKTGLFDQ